MNLTDAAAFDADDWDDQGPDIDPDYAYETHLADDTGSPALDPLAAVLHAVVCETTTEECAWDEGPCVKASEAVAKHLGRWSVAETGRNGHHWGLVHNECGRPWEPVRAFMVSESLAKILRLIGEHQCEATP